MKKIITKKIISLFTVLALVAGVQIMPAAAESAVEIGTAEELAAFRDNINSGEKLDAVLTADIDLTSVCGEENSWQPIGSSSKAFSGTFDGNGHVIDGLYISTESTDCIGLFGYTASGSVIKDLVVKGSITAPRSGGIAGKNIGTISGCVSDIDIESTTFGGGIAGYSQGAVENCKNIGSVTTSKTTAGGIVGELTSAGTITASYNYGEVTSPSNVGGIAGVSSGTITDCLNKGSILSTVSSAGGIAGTAKGGSSATQVGVFGCTNYGSVTGALNVGGISGQSAGYAVISDAENYGGISADGSGCAAGITGLMMNYAKIEKVANFADADGGQNYTAGIAAKLDSANAAVTNAYNAGEITGTYNVYGISSYNAGTVQNVFNYSSDPENCVRIYSGGTAENAFFLADASSDTGGRTAAEFADGTVLEELGDTDVWTQGDKYPVLVKSAGIRTEQDLLDALADETVTEITLAADIELTATVEISRDVTINGCGHDITFDGVCLNITADNAVLKDIGIIGGETCVSAEDKTVGIEGLVRYEGGITCADTDGCGYLYSLTDNAVDASVAVGVIVPAETNTGLSYDVEAVIKNQTVYLLLPSCVDVSALKYYTVNGYGNKLDDYEHNFNSGDAGGIKINHLVYNVKLMQSGLPALYIDINEEYGTIADMLASPDHSVKSYGDIRIDVPAELAAEKGWEESYVSEEKDADKPCTMEIRGRGLSSWMSKTKKPFQIKCEKKIDLLGMGKAKTWCLIKDEGYFVAQKLGLDLARDMGIEYTPESRFVDVYMNGEYLGCYALTEKVQIGSERVNITDLEDEVDTNGITDTTDLTGGYLVEINNAPDDDEINFYCQGSVFTVKSPENLGANSSDENYSYIKDKLSDIMNAIYSDDGKMSDGSSYLDHIDIESFVRSYWHQEYIANIDGGRGSTYFYKDRDSIDPLLYAGPIWDTAGMLMVTEGWYVKDHMSYMDTSSPTIYNRLMQRKDFVSYVIWYYENTDLKETMANVVNTINDYSDEVTAASQMDYIKWGLNQFTPTTLVNKFSARAEWISKHYLELKDSATAGEWVDLTDYDPTATPTPTATPEPSESDAVSEFTYTGGTASSDLDSTLGDKENGYKPSGGKQPDSLLKASVTGIEGKTLEWSKAEYKADGQSNVVVPIVSASEKNPWGDQTVSPAYIQVEVPASEYKTLTVSAKLGATKKGPKNYTLLYSLDGVNYTEAARYSLTANKTLEQAFDNVSIDVNNAEKVYFRIQPSDNETVNGGLLSSNPSSGEIAFNDIIIAEAEEEKPAISVTNMTVTDGRMTAEISATGAEDGVIYVAAYDENNILVGVKAYAPSDSIAANVPFSGTVESVKVMWWNDDMSPKTGSVSAEIK